jgi:hypothetical protein
MVLFNLAAYPAIFNIRLDTGHKKGDYPAVFLAGQISGACLFWTSATVISDRLSI